MRDRCKMHDDYDCELCSMNKMDNVIEFSRKIEHPIYCNCKEIFVTNTKDCDSCKKDDSARYTHTEK